MSQSQEQRTGKPEGSVADTGTRTERPVSGEGKRADDAAQASAPPSKHTP
jgi:hypothetical protein